MKRCKDWKCADRNGSYEDECECCPICGGELISDYEHSDISMDNANIFRRGVGTSDDFSNIRMGSGNAVSGGVHSSDDHSKKDSENVVNSNNETHTNSHNTTNNTTIYEAEKSASEKLEENRLKYRLECKALFRDGLISKDEERQLRELQANLNLADELVLPIKEEIRQQSKMRKTQLPLPGLSDIRQTKSIIEQNTAPALQRQLVKLEAWMQEYDDNTLKFMYYQMSSMLEHVRYTNRYEDGVKDEYWEVYWAYIAYLLQHREKQANEALASLGRWHAYYPEQNDTILLLAGRLMQNEPIEDIQQARNQLTVHFTSDLQLLLDAIDELLQMDWAKEPIVIRPTHSFYVNTLFGLFVETQKAAGLQRLKEWREQERIKREEEERIRQAELERQNKIRTQKTSVLNKFQEIGNIEIACQEAGVEFLTFNVWLEEDSTFASSYNDLVHRMEVRKYEEAERKRKEQELQEEIKQKKSQFIILFEQNKCDLLKTCTEIKVSSTDYRKWLECDEIFREQIELIQRAHDKEHLNAIYRVVIVFFIVGIVGVVIWGVWRYFDEKKQALSERDNEIHKIQLEHEILLKRFDGFVLELKDEISDSISDLSEKELPDLLDSLEFTLTKIQSFEAENQDVLQATKYSDIRDSVLTLYDPLDSAYSDRKTNTLDTTTINKYEKKIDVFDEFKKAIKEL